MGVLHSAARHSSPDRQPIVLGELREVGPDVDYDKWLSFRDVMRDSVTPFLRPDETVQVVFGAQARNPLTAALAEEFALRGDRDRHKWRIVAVTPQRILVLAAPNGRRATGILTEMPRSTRLGPPTGFLMHVIPAEGEALRVVRRLWKDIKTADSPINVGS